MMVMMVISVMTVTICHLQYNEQKMKRRAQSIIEYTVIIAAVVAAFMAMRAYLQRSVESSLSTLPDYITPRELGQMT